MTPFLFSLMLLRQRIDERISFEIRKARPDARKVGQLRGRKKMLIRRLRKALDRELLAAT